MSAWGNAWGFAWGNAWGIVLNPTPEPGMTVLETPERRAALEPAERRTVHQIATLSHAAEPAERRVLRERAETRKIRS